MVVCRKEPKAYGTGKDIEGVYSDGQTVVVVRLH
jgi:orotate phosphoribosyltransferase